MLLWALALSAAAGLAAAAAPPAASSSSTGASSKERSKAASWDEVNVLAHGLLQLGHGLKEHVERTRGQLRELSGRLSAHNASLARLERRADEEQQLGRAQRLLDGRLAQLSAQLRALLADLAAHKAAVRERLERLDGRLRQAGAENGSGSPRGAGPPAEMDALQTIMSRQNLKIEELLQKIKQQQYRMDKQNLQIKSLQSKVNMLIPLHIKENETQSPKWKGNILRSADRAANRSQNSRTGSLEVPKFPEGCHQLFLEGERSSGVFQIQPPGSEAFEVFCDMTPDGGGWTVIQRRLDGSVDFDQLWEAYKNGFGNMSGDFWLGLEKTHQIMQDGRFQLLIELQDWEGNSQKVPFLFSLGGEDVAYTLSLLGPIPGELENAMGDFPQLPFSTRDQDHDLKGDTNCAKHLSGGWWFSTCGHVNLNGKYFRSIPRQRHERKQGIFWKTWRGRYYPLKSTAMKIRPVEPSVAS
ncbi:angiopoietin-related protein 4 [Hemicordylus capensis]|uniref:angiopoietin-related protein 4 n=1 Tax=Hemicordylus capensis TaxID=884348 RepID=UPI0023042952|nr:angiopoietin-related protein 4 [Hemicordylus capensis]